MPMGSEQKLLGSLGQVVEVVGLRHQHPISLQLLGM